MRASKLNIYIFYNIFCISDQETLQENNNFVLNYLVISLKCTLKMHPTSTSIIKLNVLIYFNTHVQTEFLSIVCLEYLLAACPSPWRRTKATNFNLSFFPFLIFHTMPFCKIILVANNRIGGHPAAWIMEGAYATSTHRTAVS